MAKYKEMYEDMKLQYEVAYSDLGYWQNQCRKLEHKIETYKIILDNIKSTIDIVS